MTQRIHERATRHAARRRTAAPSSAHYITRAESDGQIMDIWMGRDLEPAIAAAKRRHNESGEKVWVWDTKTGVTLWRVDRGRGQAAGGAR